MAQRLKLSVVVGVLAACKYWNVSCREERGKDTVELKPVLLLVGCWILNQHKGNLLMVQWAINQIYTESWLGSILKCLIFFLKRARVR
jgi:hypothetical protein